MGMSDHVQIVHCRLVVVLCVHSKFPKTFSRFGLAEGQAEDHDFLETANA